MPLTASVAHAATWADAVRHSDSRTTRNKTTKAGSRRPTLRCAINRDGSGHDSIGPERRCQSRPIATGSIASCKIHGYNIPMGRGSTTYPSTVGGSVSATAVNDAVSMASQLLVAVSARSIESVDESITLSRFRMLVILGTRGPLNLSELSENLGVTPATVTRTITRLAGAGLVNKRPNPTRRREVVIGLTAAGAALVARVTELRHEEITRIVARMPEQSQRELVTALKAFNEAGSEATDLDSLYADTDEL